MPHPLAYNVTEAAAEIGIGRTSLYRLIAEDRIASITIGRRRLVTRAALEAFIASQEPTVV